MVYIFKAFFSLLTVNSYYFLAAAWHAFEVFLVACDIKVIKLRIF